MQPVDAVNNIMQYNPKLIRTVGIYARGNSSITWNPKKCKYQLSVKSEVLDVIDRENLIKKLEAAAKKCDKKLTDLKIYLKNFNIENSYKSDHARFPACKEQLKNFLTILKSYDEGLKFIFKNQQDPAYQNLAKKSNTQKAAIKDLIRDISESEYLSHDSDDELEPSEVNPEIIINHLLLEQHNNSLYDNTIPCIQEVIKNIQKPVTLLKTSPIQESQIPHIPSKKSIERQKPCHPHSLVSKTIKANFDRLKNYISEIYPHRFEDLDLVQDIRELQTIDTPLAFSITQNDTTLFKLLLIAGADLNETKGHGSLKDLFLTNKISFDFVYSLLECRFDLQIAMIAFVGVKYIAEVNQFKRLIEKQYEKQALDFNLPDNTGCTPLITLCAQSAPKRSQDASYMIDLLFKKVEFLMQYGADPTIKNHYGISAMTLLCRYVKDADQLCNVLRKIPLSKLHLVNDVLYASDCIGVYSHFISKGFDINIPDEHGRTPLFHAILRSNWTLVEFLLSRRVQLDPVSAQSSLLKEMVSLKMPGTVNMSVVNYAAHNLNKKLLELLIQLGVGEEHFDDNARRALDCVGLSLKRSLLFQGDEPAAS